MEPAKRDIGRALWDIIQRDGARILNEVMRDRAGEAPSLPRVRSLTGPAKRTAKKWYRIARQRGIRHPQWLVPAALQSTGFLVGFFVGIPLPRRDLVFTRRARPGDAITLYFISLLFIEIGLDWGRKVVARALVRSDLNGRDRRALRRVDKILENVAVGLKPGVAVGEMRRFLIARLRRKPRVSKEMTLGDSAYQRLETALAALARKRS